jgi:hypothetical protein
MEVSDSTAEVANVTGLSLISDYACRLVRDGGMVALAYVIKHNRRDGAEAFVARALKELEAARAGAWVDHRSRQEQQREINPEKIRKTQNFAGGFGR